MNRKCNTLLPVVGFLILAGLGLQGCSASSDSTPTLAEFDFNSDKSKWNFKAH